MEAGAAPGWRTLPAPLNYIHLHVRGGVVLPRCVEGPGGRGSGLAGLTTTAAVRACRLGLLVVVGGADGGLPILLAVDRGQDALV